MNQFRQGLIKGKIPFYQTLFLEQQKSFLSRMISSKRLLSFVLLSSLILLSYSNTFHASWHFDDEPNIENNYYLHLDNLKLKSIRHTFFTNIQAPLRHGDKMYRPVACMSFALNWYFGKDNVLGYHIVNIAIHILTAFFLFLTTLCLLDTPVLKNKFDNKYFIAFFSAALWALNPIQIQAVTYIVQRMAEMGAMFYLIGIYAYIKGRFSNSLFQRTAWLIICILSYLLAIGSKENTAMLPMALLLVEIIFFQDIRKRKTRVMLLLIMIGIGILILVAGSFLFLNGNLFSFLNGYSTRSFSLTERLLAEPRIIVYYLSQIFYPIPSRFSISHDVIISSSLFKPWTTIPAILIIVFLIGTGIVQIRKRPALSFAILFFFLNHIIESSIISLELIFEHRNYLPSFFLFSPVVCAFSHILNFYKNKNKFIFTLMLFFMTAIIANLCLSTFIRNKAWANDRTLWTDAARKAPHSARPLDILAIDLAWKNHSMNPHRYDMAIKLFEKALNLYMPGPSTKAEITGNLASVYYNNKHDYKKATLLYKKALELNPGNLKIRYDLISPLIMMGKWEQALKQINFLISKSADDANFYNTKGFIFLWQKKYKDALVYFKKALALMPDRNDILLNTGVTLSKMGDYEDAEKFMNRILIKKSSNKDITTFFCLIENSLRADKPANAEKYTKELFALCSKPRIKSWFKGLYNNHYFAPVSLAIISPWIEKELTDNNKLKDK